MIRSASFFILSLALHATALVYPVSFGGRGQVEIIQVKILPMEQEASGAGAQGDGSGNPARRGDSKSNRIMPPAGKSTVESNTTSDLESPPLPAQAVAKFSDSSVTLVSAIANSRETDGTVSSGSIANDSDSYSAGAVGFGNSASGRESSGLGSGGENGPGSSISVSTITQPRYLDTPRPGYPELARREGREGRVLLRVLVNDQGRTKAVEINSSSGNEALDGAAAEAVKRWHFHPARYGDKAVESWLRIPIEFRLADAKSW
jgi:TonB family protein